MHSPPDGIELQSPPENEVGGAAFGHEANPDHYLSAPDAPPSQPMRRYLASMQKAVADNPLSTLWSLFLFLGSLIFVIYFARVGYLPELDPSSSVALLLAAALTGGIYVLALLTALIWPSLFWTLYVHDNRLFRPLWAGALRPRLQSAKWFVLLFIPVHLVLLAATWRPITEPVILLLIAAAVLLMSLLVWAYRRLNGTTPRLSLLRAVGLVALGTFCWLGFCLTWFFVLTLTAGQGNPPGLVVGITTGVGLLLLVVAFNAVAIAVPEGTSPILWMAGAGMMILVVLAFNFSVSSNLSAVVMSRYGWGNVTGVSLVLNREGCLAAAHLGVPRVQFDKEETCRLDGLKVISRLGANYYVEYEGQGATVRFTLPSAAVISYARTSNPAALPTLRPTPVPTPITPPSATPTTRSDAGA